MSIPAADILASLSSASSDKPVRTTRGADAPRSGGGHKGFSSVLQRVRDAQDKGELRKSDKTLASSRTETRTEERSTVKEGRTVDHDARTKDKEVRGRDAAGTETEQSESLSRSAKRGEPARGNTNNEGDQTRAEQSDSSSSRIVKTSEGTSDENNPAEALGTVVESSVNESGAPLSPDAQGQVSLFMTTLLAATTNRQSVDLSGRADERSLQDSGEVLHTEDESSESLLVARDASTSVSDAPKHGDGHIPVTNVAGTRQTQLHPTTLSQALADSGQEAPVDVVPESSQPSHMSDPRMPDSTGGQDRSAHPSMPDTSSSPVKADSLEMKDVKLNPAMIGNNHVTESPKGDADQKVKEEFLEHPILSPAQGHSVGAQERDGSALTKVPLSQQGQKPVFEFTEDFRTMSTNQQNGTPDQGDGKLLQLTVPDQQMLNGQRAESFVLGMQGTSPSGSGSLTQGGSAPSHAQATQPVPMAVPTPLPGATKSVVFDVFQPDLGHVNVRVAVTNDVVHAHLSTDRQEVGQSLINGQDRLQSSLQAGGLDMGQFRVDIDRQSAGRSFQQGYSQEHHDRGWNQQASGADGRPIPDSYTDTRAPRRGLLNVMA